jgi:hypothetical protein
MTVKQISEISEFEQGLLIGVLVGEGSFGGDGRQPQVTLRMHIRHKPLFTWLKRCFPRSKLYDPYHHGERSYYQWMARGKMLVEDLLPLLELRLTPELDRYAYERFQKMVTRYADYIHSAQKRVTK